MRYFIILVFFWVGCSKNESKSKNVRYQLIISNDTASQAVIDSVFCNSVKINVKPVNEGEKLKDSIVITDNVEIAVFVSGGIPKPVITNNYSHLEIDGENNKVGVSTNFFPPGIETSAMFLQGDVSVKVSVSHF